MLKLMYHLWSLFLNGGDQTLNSMLHTVNNFLYPKGKELKKHLKNLRKNLGKDLLRKYAALCVAIVAIFSTHLSFAYSDNVVGFVYSALDRTTEAYAEDDGSADISGHLVGDTAVKADQAIPEPPAPEKPAATAAAPAPAKSSVSYSLDRIAAQPAGQVVSTITSVPMSAYSSTPDQTDGSPFTTASGTRVRDGVVAANFLPIGTKIRIPEYYGNKVFVVEDRMNRRYWKKVDIWMPTRSDALQWGVKYATIEVVN